MLLREQQGQFDQQALQTKKERARRLNKIKRKRLEAQLSKMSALEHKLAKAEEQYIEGDF
jgi:hypothetical protein